MAATLDMLLADDDSDEEIVQPPRRRVVGPGTWGANRASVGFSVAAMKSHDLALKDIRLAALFSDEKKPLRVSLDATAAAPTGRRHHSLPVSLFSETDSPDEPGSPSTSRPKRASLLEMIDADHPASPSKDLDVVEPTSPTTKRTKRLSGPITRPSLIEQQTAALAQAAALAGPSDDEEEASGYASETETVAGQYASPALPPYEYAQPFEIPFETPAAEVFMPSMYEQQQYEAYAAMQQQMMAQQQYEQQQFEQQQFEQQQQMLIAQQQYEQQQFEQQQMLAQQQYQMAIAQQQQQQHMVPMMQMAPMMQQMPMQQISMQQMVAPPSQFVYQPVQPHGRSTVSPPPTDRRRPAAKLASGQLLELAMDKKGSRTLQDGLPKMSDTQLARAIDELGPHLLMLAKHPAANYVVSTLASLTVAHTALVGALRGSVAELLVHPQGSRVVQAAIAELPDATAHALVGELQGQLLAAALDTHGSWGVCAAYKRTHAPFILADVMALLPQLAVQQHGCRVVQRVLEHCLPAQTSPILDEILESLLQLCRDQYGNYVIQHVLEHGRTIDRARIIELIKQMPLELSCHKFASNVVEKGLLLGQPQERAVIISAIIGEPRDPQRLQMMVRDRFANYVVQRLLDVAEPQQKEEVFWILKDQVPNLKKTSYGKHILSKLEQMASQIAPANPQALFAQGGPPGY